MPRIYTSLKPKILRAAVRLAMDKGLVAFSRADVAKSAKVARATIHYHFLSMDGLRRAVAAYAIEHELLSLLADTRAITRLGITLAVELREKIARYVSP